MMITIYLNTGEELTGEVENFDAMELSKQLNNHQITFITIGNYIVHKQSIRMIVPQPTGGE